MFMFDIETLGTESSTVVLSAAITYFDGRRKNIELAQQIAQYLTNKGKDVLVSLVSPYKDQRDKFKEKMGDNLVEVYVHTSETRGREDFFVKEYGQPTENYLDIDTTNESIEESTKKVLDYAKNSR